MVVEAKGLPIGSLLPIHATPLVAQEAYLKEEQKVVRQLDDKARTDTQIMVVAGGSPAVIGSSPEIIAEIDKKIRDKGREGGMQVEIGMDVDDRTGTLAGIDHEPSGYAHAEMLVKNPAELGATLNTLPPPLG